MQDIISNLQHISESDMQVAAFKNSFDEDGEEVDGASVLKGESNAYL